MKASNFKFLVWDSEDQKFVRRVQNDQIPTQNTKQGFKLKSIFSLFMWTGLKDSGGKDIYDGHILEVSCYPHIWRTFVTFEDGAFVVTDQDETVNLSTALGRWNAMDATTTVVGHINLSGTNFIIKE